MSNNLGKNWCRFWLGIAFFVLLPCWVLYSGWQKTSSQQLMQINQKAFSGMRKGLEQLRHEGDTAYFLQRQLNFAYGMIAEEPISSVNIIKHLQTLKKQGLGFINFRFFDADRKLIALKGESDGYRMMVQRIFESLSQPETEGEGRLLSKHRSIFEAFLGAVAPADLVAEKSALVKVLLNGGPGYFYWNTLYSANDDGRFQGGMVAWFLEKEIPANLSMLLLLNKNNAEARKQRIWGLIDLENPENSVPVTLHGRKFAGGIDSLRQLVIKMRKNFVVEQVFDGKLLAIAHIDAEKLLYCIENTAGQDYENTALLLKLIFVLSALFFVRLAYGAYAFRGPLLLLMHQRMSLITLYAAALPVICFVIVSFQYLSLQRQIQQRQTHEAMASYIENVDENYIVAVNNLEKIYHKVTKSEAAKSLNLRGLQRMGSYLGAKDAVNRMFLIDRGGNLIFTYPESQSGNDLIKKLIPTIGRKIFSSQPGNEQSWKNKVNDMMVESFTDSFSEILGDSATSFLKPFENLNKVSEFWFANRRYYVFSAFVDRSSGKDPSLMIVWQGTDSFSERYLLKQVKRNLAASEAEQPIRLAMMPRNSAKLPFPGEFSKYPFSVQLRDRVLAAETQQFSIEEAAGESWLVTAAPLKRIPGYILFAMSPVSLIESEIRQTALGITIVAIFFVLMAISLGRFFQSADD